MKLQLQRAIALLNSQKPNPDKAIKTLRPLVKKKNAPWPVFHYMGVALMQKDRNGDAAGFLRKAQELGSDQPETWHLMSVAEHKQGNHEQAVIYGQEALKRKPDFFKAWLNLGSAYRAQAKLESALKCYQKANQLDPRSAGVAFRIGSIYKDQGNLRKAMELFDITLKVDPEYHQANIQKALIHQKSGEYQEARACLGAILEKMPRDLEARISLAEVCRAEGRFEEAISRYEDILSEKPKFGAVRSNYALTLQDMGRFNESEQNYRQAFRDQPGSTESLSNYLMGLHYNPERTREEIFEAHMEWDRHFAPEIRPERPVPADKSPDRKLRVGFISGGFFRHPVGWMITEALENLPDDQFEIICYTNNNINDLITKRIHAASDKWKPIVGYSDEVVGQMIRDDEVDILVELSGHSAYNRLKTVAMEPAPVIVKWVGGLFNTSGLRAMDYLITDWHESPEGEEPCYTEKLIRMPDDYICFLPPEYAPEVGPLPAEEKGYITFGCFNNPTKVNSRLIEKWAEIMHRVPDSRLFLKSKQYDTAMFTDSIISQMESAGIARERLIFEGMSPHPELLDAYNRVDIALDPWPYSGGLSTCEALWMGVPVVTLPGPTFAGRHSTTHLMNAGLPEMVTGSREDYIAKAVALASDKEALAELRAGLRERVRLSALCDGERFGAHLAVAFREMWKQRVAGWESADDEWRDHIAVEAVNTAGVAESKSDEKQADGLQSGKEPKHNDEPAAVNLNETAANSPGQEAVNANDAASKSNEQEAGVSVAEKAAVEKEEAVANASGNGAQQASGDINANGNGTLSPETNGNPVKGSTGNGSVDSNEEKTWKIETKDDVTICTPADLNMLTPYVLLEQEQWYEPELQFVRDYLKPGMSVVDVGAGFGVYALPMAKKVGPGGKVYAFEAGSLARRHLEMSKLENGFEQLEVIGRAVSETPGKAVLKHGKTPEESTIVADGQGDEVSLVTLDAWWEFEGRPEVGLLKIDVNGEETAALKGAQQLVKEEKPLLLIALSGQNSRDFAEVAAGFGYILYEYVPGANILTEHDANAGADPYLLNLIAIHQSQRGAAKEAGWLYDEAVATYEPKIDLWKTELAKLPWTDELMEQCKSIEVSGDTEKYVKALNYLLAAEQIEVFGAAAGHAGSKKAKLLLAAAQMLINLYNQGTESAPVVFTLVRTLHALGKQGQAVAVMQKLIQTTSLGQENMSLDLPFMLPVSGQDHAPVKTGLAKWLMIRTVESWIQLKDVSTYRSGPQERKMMEVLEENPEVISEIKQRNRMHKLMTGDQDEPEDIVRCTGQKKDQNCRSDIHGNAKKRVRDISPNLIQETHQDIDEAESVSREELFVAQPGISNNGNLSVLHPKSENEGMVDLKSVYKTISYIEKLGINERDTILHELYMNYEKRRNYYYERSIFAKSHGYTPNLNNPTTFNEKILYRKIYDRNPLFPILADKYKVRDYIRSVLGKENAEEILIPLLEVSEDPERIDFTKITGDYIVKPNHACGAYKIVKSSSQLNLSKLREECKRWLEMPHGMLAYEWAYQPIKRKIIVERLLTDHEGKVPKDYKLFVFHGKCKMITVEHDRFENHTRTVYDQNWQQIPCTYVRHQGPVEKEPEVLPDMIKIAEKIAHNLDFARVDLYILENQLFFGEVTLYPVSGRGRFNPVKYDEMLGRFWNISTLLNSIVAETD